MVDDYEDTDDDAFAYQRALVAASAASTRRPAGTGWLLVGGLMLLLVLLGPRRGGLMPARALPALPLPAGITTLVNVPSERDGTAPLHRAGDVGMHVQRALNASGAVCAPADLALQCPPSLRPAQIDAILASYGSPATGTGAIWHGLGVQYGIDPAWALAFFIHESRAGTNPRWAGRKPDGRTTHNVGNIICTGGHACYGRFRAYDSWEAGIHAWYRLIAGEYIQGRGHRTVADVIPVYAPAVENHVQGYIDAVAWLVATWRQGKEA